MLISNVKNLCGPLLFSLVIVSVLGVVLPSPEIGASTEGQSPADIAWMLGATGLVLLMTPGLSFFYGGMVDQRNVISTMLQSFICMGVISLLWVFIGFSIAFGDSVGGFFGNPFQYIMFNGVGLASHKSNDPSVASIATNIPFALFAMFQLKFAIITPALITGSFAERVRFSSFMLFMVLFSLFIYSPLAHCTWHPSGFLFKWGVLDFAGGTVVHISAGCAALAGAMVLGKRKHKEDSIRPSSVPYVILGTGMLWFGWFGFNAGSALGANQLAVKAFLNTNTASAAAMLAWILFDGYKGAKPSAMGACIGAVVGLVAITPAAGYVTVGQSFFIGCISSIVSNLAVRYSSRFVIDDTLDVFPCHGLGGITGMILTAVFARTDTASGLLYGGVSLFFTHIVALLIVVLYSFCGSFILFKLTDFLIPLRVTDEQELQGLDISQHGESVLVLSV
jgi:Amt family ammonium transporter